MTRFCVVLAIALPALAQDDAAKQKAMERMQVELKTMAAESRFLGISGAAMGSPVKGAPYSGVEVTESTQVLADGTRIHNETSTSVYRDSEGRVRRETPKDITIWDPVANVSYFLDPKTQTVRKGSMMRNFVYTTRDSGTGGGPSHTMVEVRTKDGVTTATVNGQAVDPSTVKAMEKAVPEGEPPAIFVRRAAGGGVAGGEVLLKHATQAAPSEPLGSKVVEGVNCDGSRSVATLDTGAIGNDRPIEIVNERWYSPELKTVVMTRHNDPRTGEETFRLTNINRAEPPAYLFQVPPGYQPMERK